MNGSMQKYLRIGVLVGLVLVPITLFMIAYSLLYLTGLPDAAVWAGSTIVLVWSATKIRLNMTELDVPNR